MIDNHIHPDEWGILPSLFSVGNLEISSYSFFVILGLLLGTLCYFTVARRLNQRGEGTIYIAVAAIVGGVLGAKLPFWIFNIRPIIEQFPDIMLILSGRTITGGLIGGILAVMYIKKRLGIKERRGNLFVPAIAIGVAVGRLGCFFRGCCYGTPTGFFTGIDFGDHVMRHPTQLYEIAFFILFFIFALTRIRTAPPGKLFNLLINSYFIFRFFEEFLRYNDQLYLGLSFYQYISLIAILFINLKSYFEKKETHGRVLPEQQAKTG